MVVHLEFVLANTYSQINLRHGVPPGESVGTCELGSVNLIAVRARAGCSLQVLPVQDPSSLSSPL